MHAHQELRIAYPISLRPLWEAISAALRRLVQLVRDDREAAEQERIMSRLAPHLRYDIGLIDHLPPPPRPLEEVQRSHQQSLETMWLRYY